MSIQGNLPIRFLVMLPTLQCFGSRGGILDIAQGAEEMGFWGVGVQDRLFANESISWCGESHDPDGDERFAVDPMQSLAFVAAKTEKLKVMTDVLVLPRHNAINLAQQATSLQELSEGRLILGVGVGAPVGAGIEGQQNLSSYGRMAAMELGTYGVKGHRGKLMDESIAVLQALWTQDPASFDGQYYSFEGVTMHPQWPSGVPMWIGGRSEHALRRAVEVGDGWAPSQIGAKAVKESIDWMNTNAPEGKGAPSTISVNLFSAVAPTDEQAKRLMRASFGGRFSEEGLATITLCGSPGTVIARIQEYIDVGVTVFDFKPAPASMSDTMAWMRIMSQEVIPAFG